MEGYIVNNSGKHRWIFKRKFPVGHKVFLSELWEMYEKKVKKALEKSTISEKEFVGWLTERGSMRDGFIYYPGEKSSFAGEVVEVTPVGGEAPDNRADGRLVKPSLAKASRAVIDKLSFTEIANLRILDDPKKIVDSISNLHKLRRAYTKVRSMPRKGHLQRILRERIQDLEHGRG